MRKLDKNGFTLVEVIVTVLLLSILALGVYALFSVYLRTARQDTALMRMHRQSEAIMDEVARAVRAAYCIFPAGTPLPSDVGIDEACMGDSVNVPGIVLYNENGVPLQGFHLGGRVRMCRGNDCSNPFATWGAFTIDGREIETDPESSFLFPDNRVQVSANLRLVDGDFDLNIERGIFQCRRL
jgi:prepilin-type N-terminal cleavage/methylation domain-containing protein